MKNHLRIWATLSFCPLFVVAFVLPSPRRFSGVCVHASGINESCDVAIFGGGFGGLYTALALSEKAKSTGERLDIALIDPSDSFVFLPLLYDLVIGTASEAEVCPNFSDLLEETGVRHIQASFKNYTSSDLLHASVEMDYGEPINLSFKASVVSVGATPQATLSSVPGALDFVQPFYTREDAFATKLLLEKLDLRIRSGKMPRVAVVGGGYGGVELAACLKRRLPECHVQLLARGPPMKGTRAEPLVYQALQKLGVEVELCSVVACKGVNGELGGRVLVERTEMASDEPVARSDEAWDAVLWTAGSGPSKPVCEELLGLQQLRGSGRLITDGTLRCSLIESDKHVPPVWALGDCAEVIDNAAFVAPKTAQTAIQQADVVAANVLASIRGQPSTKVFKFQDLGSMLILGGPNAAILAPKDDALLAPLFTTALDVTRVGFGLADGLFAQVRQSPVGKESGFGQAVENLGLSLGGYGLGVPDESAPGTLSGTLSGAARRAIYALRMPTKKQRTKSAVLGAISSATALAREVSDQLTKNSNSTQ